MDNIKKNVNNTVLQGFVDKKLNQPPYVPSTETKH